MPRAAPTCRCTGNGNSSMVRNTQSPIQVAQYLGRKSANRIANAHVRSTLSQGPHGIWRMYSLLQRLQSLRHSSWYGVSERTTVARCVRGNACSRTLYRKPRAGRKNSRVALPLPLTLPAISAWRLPPSLLAPERLFRQIRHNLRPNGPLLTWRIMDGRSGVGPTAAPQQDRNPWPIGPRLSP